MNSRDKLATVLAGRLKALVTDLPSARQGVPDALHRTRVASRRMREVLPVLEPALPEARLRKTRRTTRRITRALGGVRELDVALGLLDSLPATEAVDRIAIERLRARVQRDRQSMHALMLHRLEELKPEKLVKKLHTQTVEKDGTPAGPEWRSLLAARIRRRADRLRDAIRYAGAIYLTDRLHAVRVAVKKLRYAIELAGEARVAGAKATVRSLKKAQDTLGDLHDREVLISLIERARTDQERSEIDTGPEMERLVRRLEGECRLLHARYLASQEILREMCDTAERVALRLEGQPSRPRTSLAAVS
jgi:CHAD domain-containing protein